MEQELAWLRQDILSDDQRRRAAAHALGIPFVALRTEDINPAALVLLPEPVCRSHNLVAFHAEGNTLHVALLDMNDLAALEPLRTRLKYKIVPRLTDRASLTRALLIYQKVLKERFGTEIQEAVTNDQPQALADALLGHALTQRASQVHLEEREQGLLVRYRHGSVLRDAMTMPRHAAKGLFSRLKSLARMPEVRGVHEGRFTVGSEEKTAVRLSVVPLGPEKEKITLHLLREGQQGFTLESLGLHGLGIEAMHRALGGLHGGLVVVCGPAGSGKTTTLYTLLDTLAAPERSIATIEENIEYHLPYAAQMVTVPDIGLTLAAGLRAQLRAEPDVVMVSDLSDPQTLTLALHAANRGVLVLAAMQAPSCGSAVEKLRALGADPRTLATVLRVVIATGVVRRLCVNKEQYRPARIELSRLEGHAQFAAVLAALKDEHLMDKNTGWKDVPLYRAVPCSLCQGGYQGRIGVQALLPHSAVLARLIEEGAPAEELEAAAREDEMLSITEDALYKAAQGQTSVEEVLTLAGE